MFYLVCYDVVEDRRRNQVATLFEGYGMRVQKSVFECVLTPEQYQMILKRLPQYLDLAVDQVRFYPMSPRHRKKVVVVGVQPTWQVDDHSFIV
ncbi:CRISPR-associated endonuclease Cas2 [Synechococcales cyanobacterium C]|uniref:CRISPR-associated endoribonuclease Cas2 n=1 Tax=Petrachloros mirabilis ULC683 TaxID=2781853 RepID=A0A8K2A1C2_9CYAN|nr:CRISPR-associated endonuclease Cas2 [Petrachloros mirabilis]NCJ08007.1 CRISPR-associated endonuclease Cas2 [Petrachloros mirabilis ULC683]